MGPVPTRLLHLARVVVLAAGAAAVAGLHASQNAPIPPSLPALADIHAAEAEGARFPTGAQASVQGGVDAAGAVGTAARTCVEVGDATSVRAGDFLAGPFGGVAGFRDSWQAWHTKVWWAPRYLADRTPRDLGDDGLVVRGTRLDAPAPPMTYRYGELVRSADGTGFFNSGVWVPSAGRWMLVATFGPNWGCFVVVTRAAGGAIW